MPCNQKALRIRESIAVAVSRMSDIVAIRLHMPRICAFRHLQVNVVDKLLDLSSISDADQSLNTAVKIAVHQICRTDPYFRPCSRAFADLRPL